MKCWVCRSIPYWDLCRCLLSEFIHSDIWKSDRLLLCVPKNVSLCTNIPFLHAPILPTQKRIGNVCNCVFNVFACCCCFSACCKRSIENRQFSFNVLEIDPIFNHFLRKNRTENQFQTKNNRLLHWFCFGFQTTITPTKRTHFKRKHVYLIRMSRVRNWLLPFGLHLQNLTYFCTNRKGNERKLLVHSRNNAEQKKLRMSNRALRVIYFAIRYYSYKKTKENRKRNVQLSEQLMPKWRRKMA